MAFINDDRVLDTTLTTGTGNITLVGAAPTGFQTFPQAMADNSYFHYCIVGGGEWEVGLGELVGAGTIARRQVFSSSNADALVSFAAGTKSVFVTQPGNRKGTSVIFISLSTGQVVSTTTETTLIGAGVGSLTFPANTLFIGRTLRIQMTGVISTAAVPGTLRIKIKLGSTVILDTSAQTPTASVTNLIWRLDAVITVRTVGSVDTVIGQATFEYQATALAALVTWGMTQTAALTTALNTSHTLDVTAQWNTSSADNNIRCTNMTVESLN